MGMKLGFPHEGENVDLGCMRTGC